MKKYKSFFRFACLFFFFFLLTIDGFSIVVEGINKEYAGKKLHFYRYSNPVTREKVPVFVLDVDNEGFFKKEIKINSTTFVFCDFGIYRGMLFIEPKQKIELVLPPLREKSFADKKNPFFQPVEFWFNTKNGNQLNDRVAAFDRKLNQLTDKYFSELYFRNSKEIFDTVSSSLKKEFKAENGNIFEMHKKFRLKSIEADAFRLNPPQLAEVFNSADKVTWTHPAFMNLFEKTYSNKLSFEAKTIEGKKVRKAVAQNNLSSLIDFLTKEYKLTSPGNELVLLKMLHDAYYSGDFTEDAIIKLVASDQLQNSRYAFISETAENVLSKLKYLRRGSKAPPICLNNTEGEKHCSDASNNKFKYLIFADTEMIVCREHLKYLTKIENQFREHLEIIIVLRNTNRQEMQAFLSEEEIPGKHLVDENGEYIGKYRVKSYPTSILLNENHNVVFQQAKAPLDGFEQQFGAFLQKELFLRQRNQGR